MPQPTYTDEFKASAARLVRDLGYTVTGAAKSLGVDPGSIRRWVFAFAQAPTATTADASAEQLQRENARLREENRRLLMEREILKKATAFFAREQP